MTNPASPYLLDRLQARRANPATRSRRSDSTSRLSNLDDDLFIDEARSSANDNLTTTPNNAHAPVNATASLGAREMEKRMDKLSKLNFDLKLELFHCRERMAKLQDNCKLLASRAEDANRLVEENATLLDLNDSLVKELEHRDEAVQEAVSIICDLEERLERSQQSQQARSDLTEAPAPTYAASSSPYPQAILPPPKADKSAIARPSSASPQKRIPSFVGDEKPNTRALRSVYLEPTPMLHAVKSFASLMPQREDVDKSVSDVDTLDSPRLSVLSESSFPSIYDLPRGQDNVKYGSDNITISDSQLENISRNAGSKRDSGSDINSWMQVQTPQSSVQSSERGVQQPIQFTAPSQFMPKRTPSLKASTFGALLPPTPDSASTSLLQDSYMTGQSTHRTTANLPNAEKHAALLHTPEPPSVVDMSKEEARPDAKHVLTGAGWFNRHSVSLSSTDEEDGDYEQSHGLRTGSAGSDGSYPNGGSILKGTPSRFQVRRNISSTRGTGFEGRGLTTDDKKIPLKQNDNRRRRMERSETTPNLALMQTPPSTLQRNNSTSRSSNLRPQRMERSETTPNLTTNLQLPSSISTFQPGPPITKPQVSSGGVRAALSHKTQKLFRRMSEHHTSSSDQSSRSSRGMTVSPSKRPNITHSGRGSDDSLAMQAANQAVSSYNLGVTPSGTVEAKSPSRGLFSRAAGSLRR
ncbi:hypothetical protein AUEXF2481DRAFT_683340 [Aureobasidium subglaciale EXF-2481]|uniref:Centrosomin N-terminal motif 1 domain-containing protein n=1 Tax=Aureobasidium subglaciale (strain EXF-2481) TaxID=1043005 RepID=A0A074ZAA6_AURSE|nr:uncharacterized protein AUEXF2481DRAFT_683340 [Aureobasidium subglaciale EXF-2481]KEQ95701.1 hypothetical protein AUEXF2481DRAFT_683340 [Aureobasidium subglaciale EXF-2481]